MSSATRQNTASEREEREERKSTQEATGNARADLPYAAMLNSKALPRGHDEGTQLDRGTTFNFWVKGSLIKCSPAAVGEDDAVRGKDEVHLIVAAKRDGNHLLGIELKPFRDEVSDSECIKLAKDRKAMFVTDGSCKLPKWLNKDRYSDLVLRYDHPDVKGLLVGRLTCVEFNQEDGYEPLAAGPRSASLSQGLWEEAIKRGDNVRRDAAGSIKGPLSERVTLKSNSPTDAHGGARKESRGKELLSKVHAKGRLVGTGTTGATAYGDKNGTVNVKGRGMVTMLDEMGLAADNEDENVGNDESLQAGGKRKRSEDTTDEDREDDVVTGSPAPKGARLRDETKVRKISLQAMVHSNTAFPYGTAGLSKPSKTTARGVGFSTAVAPEGQSHIDPGHAAVYTEAEGKQLWTGR